MARNRIKLWTEIYPGEWTSHLSIHEFENRDGVTMIHSSVPISLERTRRDLNYDSIDEIIIKITRYGTIRSDAENEALAADLGWADEGGRVSRKSQHLWKYGGVAVDFSAWRQLNGMLRLVPHETVGRMAMPHFDKVFVYDTHVHGDNRYGGLRCKI